MFSNTRRAFLRGALSASPLLAQAGEAGNGNNSAEAQFPGVAYRNYPRCLPNYLRRLASAAREKRDANLARIVSAQAVHDRQRWVRKTLLDLIGAFPEKSDLNAKVAGSFERQGY